MAFKLDSYQLPVPVESQLDIARNTALENYGIDIDQCPDVIREIIIDYILHGSTDTVMNVLYKEQNRQANQELES